MIMIYIAWFPVGVLKAGLSLGVHLGGEPLHKSIWIQPHTADQSRRIRAKSFADPSIAKRTNPGSLLPIRKRATDAWAGQSKCIRRAWMPREGDLGIDTNIVPGPDNSRFPKAGLSDSQRLRYSGLKQIDFGRKISVRQWHKASVHGNPFENDDSTKMRLGNAERVGPWCRSIRTRPK